MSRSKPAWLRTIAYADMDAFYAAIEQLDNSTFTRQALFLLGEKFVEKFKSGPFAN